jgi:signal transduction histidine kinase
MVYHHLKTQSVWVIGYVVLASVGIMMAIPPGYASPIFPAAGFAVAIMLWSAGRAWPAIVLGSFLLNLFLTHHLDISFLTSLMIALPIGLGAALQAHVAAGLVQWVLKTEWRKMESVSSIVYTLLLAGPIASLIAASNANLVLYLSGVISADELTFSWWSWWVGDSLGVIVMLPICIGVLCRHEAAWKNRIRSVFLPILVMTMMVGVAFVGTSRLEKEYFNMEVQEQGESFKNLLQQRFTAHQEAIASLRRLIEVTPEMTVDQFEYFTRITLLDNPDISALSVNAYVQSAERREFEQRMQQVLQLPAFHLKEKQDDGNLVMAAERQDYVVVQHISPMQTNAAAIGYDINSEPKRREAIRAAILSGKPAVTAPIQLLQGEAEAAGLLVLHPAFHQDSAAEGASKLFAFAVAVLKIDEMIETATAGTRNPKLLYRVMDTNSHTPDAVIYQTPSASEPTNQDYRGEFDLLMADRLWRLEVLPTPSYLQEIRSWTAWAVGVGGLLGVSLLQVLMLTITGQNSLIRRQVAEQTRELQAKTDAITDRNAQLDAIFHCSPDGFIAFAEDGTIKYANPALLRMLDLHDERSMTESAFNEFLRQRLAQGQVFSGVSAYFAEADKLPQTHVLNLIAPKKLSLQVLGMRTAAVNIPRILYFRDATHEFEVQKMKSDFLSHAAHELRTPMTTILGYTELLLTRDYSKEVRDELLLIVQRQTNLIVTMINDLLDLARIEANSQPQIHFAEFDLTALVKELVSELTFDLQRWPVRMRLPETSLKIQGDKQKIRQAIMNLIVNAQKYSPAGGSITLELSSSADHILLAIEDHGIGMSEDELTHIGEKFWRADTTGKSPGTGLGVAIVKEIIHAHGGDLAFVSTPGRGTKVSIRLLTNLTLSHKD